LSASVNGVQLIACETCGSKEPDARGRTRGQQLIALLRELSAANPAVSVGSTRCLWSCSRSCAVHLRSDNRSGYVIGTLEPTQEYARALLEYAGMYADTPDGAVPFKLWPQPLRGHFICRIPAHTAACGLTPDADAGDTIG
jgi:predicted metal-binding protein